MFIFVFNINMPTFFHKNPYFTSSFNEKFDFNIPYARAHDGCKLFCTVLVFRSL